MTYAQITVNAGPHGRRHCPVSAAVELPIGMDPGSLAFRDESNGRTVPFQIYDDGDSKKIAWIIDDLPVEWQRRYVLIDGDGTHKSADAGVSVDDNGEKLSFTVGGSVFTQYNYGESVARPYFYPLFAGPDAGITRNWPMVPDAENETNDHKHHKGLYTAQGEVNGTDNWGEEEGHGYQIHKGFSEVYSGPVAGGFTEELVWTDGEKKPNMAEERRVAIYSVPVGIRIVDYDVTLKGSHGEVTLGDTKEGGLISVRVATSMDGVNPDGGVILNSFGGITESETWGKRAQWCDYSGPVKGSWYGICMMDSPSNPRHPTYWHVRDYGLMTANCFGVHHFTGDPSRRKDFTIAEGDAVTWRYRTLIHAGRGDFSSLTRCYHDYANPPEISVE